MNKLELKIVTSSSDTVHSTKWDIEEADEAVNLETQYGGKIEHFGSSNMIDKTANNGSANKWLYATVLLVVAVGCIGFLVVVMHDVYFGLLGFKTFMDYVIYFLGALGIGQLGNKFNKKTVE